MNVPVLPIPALIRGKYGENGKIEMTKIEDFLLKNGINMLKFGQKWLQNQNTSVFLTCNGQ
jgi:hypothetical protein